MCHHITIEWVQADIFDPFDLSIRDLFTILSPDEDQIVIIQYKVPGLWGLTHMTWPNKYFNLT